MKEEKNNKIYDVSVILMCYNNNFRKTTRTLDSIISQQDVKLEIIVADDGSKDNHKKDLETYFKKNNFNNFKLVLSETNKGTVCNCYAGILKSEGKYLKFISPGDEFRYVSSLKDWMDKLIESNRLWSFCDAVYYKEREYNRNTISSLAHPNNIKPYKVDNAQLIRWNYVVLNDIVLGAATLCERKLAKEYIEKIIGKVKYAEDNIWRIAVFDGVIPYYYNDATLLYECDSGVSSGNSSVWKERLRNDWLVTNEIMFGSNKLNSFQIKMKKYALINDKKNKFLKIFIPGMLLWKVKRIVFPRKTPKTFDRTLLLD